MRRNEFEITDRAEIEDFLSSVHTGTVSFNADPYPYSLPVNFIFADGKIYYHGASHGKKAELAAEKSLVQFLAFREYSYIPSYFSGNDASGATYFFKSVMLFGTLTHITDAKEKCRILNLLMDKYQPEGKFTKLTDDAEQTAKLVEYTDIVAITTDKISAKFKFGQNLSDEQHLLISTKLLERGSSIDIESAALMKKYRLR